jgi:hypothetical protein
VRLSKWGGKLIVSGLLLLWFISFGGAKEMNNLSLDEQRTEERTCVTSSALPKNEERKKIG